MGDISEHFNRSEFACQCGCGFDTVDAELATVLETIRGRYDRPVKINSGARCTWHNGKVGGAPDSRHRIGQAADIVVSGVDPDDVADYLEETYPDRYGIGRYHGRTHIDVRKTPARWDVR